MTGDAITLTKRKQVCENNFYSVFFDNLDQDNWELPGGLHRKRRASRKCGQKRAFRRSRNALQI